MEVWENLGIKPSANQFAELTSAFLIKNPTLHGEANEINCTKETINIDDDSSSSLIDRSEEVQLEAAIKASLEMSKQTNIASSVIEEDNDSLLDDDDDLSVVGDDNSNVKSTTRESDEPSCGKKHKLENTKGPSKGVAALVNKDEDRTRTEIRDDSSVPPSTPVIVNQSVLAGEIVKILLRTPSNERRTLPR